MTPRDVAEVARLEAEPALATAVAAAEYDRLGAVLDALPDAAWDASTDCPPWDVRQLVAHVVGATEANAHPLEMLRQLREGRRGLAVDVDPVNAAQVRTRGHLAGTVLRARYREAVPGAVAWRRRWTTKPLSTLRFRVGAPVHETWTLAYLAGTIYTRDTWMHRVDICLATGLPIRLDAGHDAVVVADVVADWARRHGRPFRLTLTGPAGGEFVQGGHAVETLRLGAVDFCRVVSGRATGGGLLATPVPF